VTVLKPLLLGRAESKIDWAAREDLVGSPTEVRSAASAIVHALGQVRSGQAYHSAEIQDNESQTKLNLKITV
jgi:hypothetical protein